MTDEYCLDCDVRGRCCYWNIIIDNKIYKLPTPCIYLDTLSGLCTIYDKRHEINPLCLSIEEMKDQELLPKGCKYLNGKKSVVIDYEQA